MSRKADKVLIPSLFADSEFTPDFEIGSAVGGALNGGNESAIDFFALGGTEPAASRLIDSILDL
jgi:hypothetical protein